MQQTLATPSTTTPEPEPLHLRNRTIKFYLPVINHHATKKATHLKVVTRLCTDGAKTYYYSIAPVEQGEMFETQSLGRGCRHTIEAVNRYSDKRLIQLAREAQHSISTKTGIVWGMVEQTLTEENLTLA